MDSSKSSTSVMFCGSAYGRVLAPYVVYKSGHLWDQWIIGGPKNTRYNRSKSGWFDGTCFLDWFFSCFIPSTMDINRRIILIGHNLASHFTKDVIEEIFHSLCIPRISTHIRQPLDVAFYGPLERKWRATLDEWKQQTGKKSQTVTKRAFPGLLKKLFEGVCGDDDNPVSENLVSGFTKCGIYRLNRQKVLERLASTSRANGTETDDGKIAPVVSAGVIEMLSKMRHPGTKQTQGRAKIKVKPGKSISIEDLDSSTTSEDTEDTVTQYTSYASSESSEPADSGSDMETDAAKNDKSSSCNHIDVLCCLLMKKTTKYYIGMVTEPENDDEEDGDYYVRFMRRVLLQIKCHL